MVDDRCGIITAVATTPGDVAEPAQVTPLLAQHEQNTGREVTAFVGDRGYGTVETCCDLIVQGVRPHLTPMQPAGHKSEALFTKEDFRYDEAADVYVCPVGHRLEPRRHHQRRQMTDYVADKKVCAQCPLRAECTRSKIGRSVARHWREADLEVALAFARLPEAQADRRRRRYLMEGSFRARGQSLSLQTFALAQALAAANPRLDHCRGAKYRPVVRRAGRWRHRHAAQTAQIGGGGQPPAFSPVAHACNRRDSRAECAMCDFFRPSTGRVKEITHYSLPSEKPPLSNRPATIDCGHLATDELGHAEEVAGGVCGSVLSRDQSW